MATNADRYTVREVETVAPNDIKIVIYYIWDEENNRIVKTHHLKPVINKNLELLRL